MAEMSDYIPTWLCPKCGTTDAELEAEIAWLDEPYSIRGRCDCCWQEASFRLRKPLLGQQKEE